MARWKVSFSDLELIDKIGKGNFGEVWKGKYLGLDVAIKKLFFVDDDFMQKYIEREMDTLRGLNHPNIVQLMGLCTETGDIYIVTEFVGGGNLRQILKSKQELTWERRLGFALDIALAMTYLHHKDIMHRDLKSANLLVSTDWKLKVCDFGLARNSPSEGEKFITTVGTNEWMAPEVALQDPYDKSADVFSYGMVLYEILTRKKPPPRKLRDGYAFDLSLKANIPEDTPAPLWNLLVDCAAQNAAKRPTFPEIVKRLKDIKLDGGGEKSDSGDSDSSSEDNEEDSSEDHEESTSYIARGREITEVNKFIKPAFRKVQYCKIEVSIPKKDAWKLGSEVAIKVRIENRTAKPVKTIRMFLKTTKTLGKKQKILKSKTQLYKGEGLPVKEDGEFDETVAFTLPKTDVVDSTHQLVLEFLLGGGLSTKTATALLPIGLEDK